MGEDVDALGHDVDGSRGTGDVGDHQHPARVGGPDQGGHRGQIQGGHAHRGGRAVVVEDLQMGRTLSPAVGDEGRGVLGSGDVGKGCVGHRGMPTWGGRPDARGPDLRHLRSVVAGQDRGDHLRFAELVDPGGHPERHRLVGGPGQQVQVRIDEPGQQGGPTCLHHDVPGGHQFGPSHSFDAPVHHAHRVMGAHSGAVENPRVIDRQCHGFHGRS